MRELDCGGLHLAVFDEADPRPRPVLWLNVSAPEDGAAAAAQLAGRCSLLCAVCDDWDRDLTPWPAPALNGRREAFAGGGPARLQRLLAALPQAEAQLAHPVTRRGIAGYSLAGLFALDALLRCDAFAGAASVSGSLWYDGWAEWAQRQALPVPRPPLYLSLGDREAAVRNPRMAQNAQRTQQLAAHWAQQTEVCFAWNSGGHFDDADGRTARGAVWLAARL